MCVWSRYYLLGRGVNDYNDDDDDLTLLVAVVVVVDDFVVVVVVTIEPSVVIDGHYFHDATSTSSTRSTIATNSNTLHCSFSATSASSASTTPSTPGCNKLLLRRHRRSASISQIQKAVCLVRQKIVS